LQLDDRLPHFPDTEPVTRSRREALHRGGERGQVLGLLAGQILGRRDRQPVPGEDDCALEVGQPVGQIVQ
jgi:hypothetical protein